MKKQHSAIMQKILVFNMNGSRVGNGYLIYRDDGRMLTPTLFDENNIPLPEGMYNFMPQENETTLIILPKMEKQ